MNIFIIGLPGSGRSTLAKKLVSAKFTYIDAASWIKDSFRLKLVDEHEHQYQDALHNHITKSLFNNGYSITEYVKRKQKEYSNSINFIIDGVCSPQDFSALFNPKSDIVIFLNCNNNSIEHRDYEVVGASVIRDCCFWLSAASLLDSYRWLEYNFSIPGISSDAVKKLSHKNTVFITKSLEKTISHAIDYINLLNL